MTKGYTSVFDVYHKIRSKETLKSLACLVIGIILFAIVFGFKDGSWKDIFYGINRAFLLIGILFIVYFLYNVILYIFRVDTIRIKRLIRSYPGNHMVILNNLEAGKIYSSGTADTFLVSTNYCLFYSVGRYHLVRTGDIKKLGYDVKYVNKHKKEILICLLKNGERYEMYINRMQAMEIADYMKKNDQGIWA